jgi:hypothetical protein
MINTQLSQLGEQPLSVDEELPAQDLSELIKWRLDQFKSKGKI